jgi:hypothetical protein
MEMGSDKIRLNKLGRDKLKKSFWGVKIDQKMSKSGNEKSGRFVIFLGRFLSFLSKMGSIRIYRKTAPTKSTVLGPRPPPWRKHEIY